MLIASPIWTLSFGAPATPGTLPQTGPQAAQGPRRQPEVKDLLETSHISGVLTPLWSEQLSRTREDNNWSSW